MAGLRGNQGWILSAKQTGKGALATIAASSAYKNPFSGGNVGPVRDTDNLAETDSSRDQGIAYVQTSGVEGEPQIYVRDASIGYYLFAALGADAVTGTTPNYTHVLTPANSLPYITVWKNLADTLYEQYLDCKVNTLTISAEAGQPLQATVALQGRQSTRLTADPDSGSLVAVANQQVYNYNNAAVTLGGSSTSLVRSFELTVENNVTRQQTDDVVPYDVVEGQRQVSLSFDLIFENLDEYNKFHYGGASGTVISPNIFSTSAVFDFSLGANNDIAFNLPSIAYQEFSPEPDPGGDPITVSVRAVAQRGGSPIVTATVKNQIATY